MLNETDRPALHWTSSGSHGQPVALQTKLYPSTVARAVSADCMDNRRTLVAEHQHLHTAQSRCRSTEGWVRIAGELSRFTLHLQRWLDKGSGRRHSSGDEYGKHRAARGSSSLVYQSSS
eukprot:2627766-Prymnesium_polylepis.3